MNRELRKRRTREERATRDKTVEDGMSGGNGVQGMEITEVLFGAPHMGELGAGR